MTDNITSIDGKTPEEVLAFVQNKRFEFLTSNELETKHAVTLLRDLGKSAVDQMRLKADTDIGSNIAELATAIYAAAIKGGNQNPFAVDEDSVRQTPITLEVDALDVEDTFSDDTLSTELATLNYEEFVKAK